MYNFGFTHDSVAYIHIFYMYLIKIIEHEMQRNGARVWWKYLFISCKYIVKFYDMLVDDNRVTILIS